jgi:hypothetical protein
MTDYLLLKDPTRCPGCGYKGRFPRNGVCGTCGLRLFPSLEYDFAAFDRDTAMNFWAFDRNRGWISRDHILIANAQPNKRTVNLPKLARDYGRHTTPDEVAKGQR